MSRVGVYTISFFLAEDWQDVRDSLARQLVGGYNYEHNQTFVWSLLPLSKLWLRRNSGWRHLRPEKEIFRFLRRQRQIRVPDINEEFDDEFFQSTPASVIEVCGCIV